MGPAAREAGDARRGDPRAGAHLLRGGDVERALAGAAHGARARERAGGEGSDPRASRGGRGRQAREPRRGGGAPARRGDRPLGVGACLRLHGDRSADRRRREDRTHLVLLHDLQDRLLALLPGNDEAVRHADEDEAPPERVGRHATVQEFAQAPLRVRAGSAHPVDRRKFLGVEGNARTGQVDASGFGEQTRGGEAASASRSAAEASSPPGPTPRPWP